MNTAAICYHCRQPVDKSTQGFTQSHHVILHSGACHNAWHKERAEALHYAIIQRQQFQGLRNVF